MYGCSVGLGVADAALVSSSQHHAIAYPGTPSYPVSKMTFFFFSLICPLGGAKTTPALFLAFSCCRASDRVSGVFGGRSGFGCKVLPLQTQ